MKNIYSTVVTDGCSSVFKKFFLNKINIFKSITFCVSVLTLSINATAQTVVVSDNDVTCNGASNGDATANVSGGTPPYAYVWNNAQTTQTISGLSIGVYSVTITDALNNTAQGTTIVSQPPEINKSGTVTDVSCNGLSDGAIDLNVSGGIPPYTFDWDNDGIGDNDDPEDLNNIPAGTYSVTITDDFGCTANVAITVNEESPIQAIPLVTNITCPGEDSGSIILLVSGGGNFYTYDWNIDGTGDFDDPKNISNLSAGTYSVTVKDINGCIHMVSGQVTEPTAISPNAVVTGMSCVGEMDASIDLTPSGGTAPYTFLWDNGLGTTEDVIGLGIGTYNVTIIDANNCTNTTAYTINGQTVLTATTTKINATCKDSTDGAIDLTITGGTPPYSFSWSNGMTVEDPSGLPVGGYTVTVTDANGCMQITSGIINSPDPITTTVFSNDPSCFGNANGSLDITNTGGTTPYTYLWSNGATFEDLFGIPAGTYSVTITDVTGCTNSETYTISQPSQMAFSLGANQNLCLGNSITLTPTVSGGNAPYVFSWDNGLGFGPSKTVSPTTTTTYSVTVTDDSGCTEVDEVTINVNTCDFDLALIKTLATGQSANVTPGDTVAFEIAVTNQGLVDANNISILDYIDLADWSNFSSAINPNGVTTGAATLNYAWTTIGTDARALIAGIIPAGATVSVPINLVVAPGISGLLTNEAEIYTDNNNDIDSQPESEEGDLNADIVINNEINNTGGDEDDHDISSVSASIYDLAITKQLAPTQATTASPGDKVDFIITIFNQGTVWANNVQLIDYVNINSWNNFSLADNPVGISGGAVSLNYSWSLSSNNAIANIVGAIPPGQTIEIPVSLTIKSGVTGTLFNWVEVFRDNGDDIDSQTENEEGNGNNDVTIDDVTDNTGGDMDDHDGASILSEMYDIALKKELAVGQTTPVESGSVVEFLITIYNQGTLPATGIQIIDYVNLSDWAPFDLALNPAGTTGGNLSAPYTFATAGTNGLATINGSIPGGSFITIPVKLKVRTGASGLLSNHAEIYNDDGNEVDSQPEFEEVDVNGDVLVDDVIDNTNGDEDDHDVATISAFIYDIALRKEIAPTQNVNVNAGDLVTFNITVFNQGDVVANNIRVIDYVDATMWEGFNFADNLAGTTTGSANLTYSWANSANIFQATISGGIPAGGQVTFPVHLTALSGVCGWIDNYAEIYEDDGFDIDSQPEFWENDMNADTLVNDVINNAADDEDDHDIASVYVNKFDLALTKTLAGGQAAVIGTGSNITFTLTITNQGDLDAYNINLVDYLPTGTTLVDPAWTQVGGNATYNIAGPIVGNGGVATVNITLNVGAAFSGTSFDNCAEIMSASDESGGSPVTDFDSTHDNNPGNDGPVNDNNINSTDGDEDDHDCEIVNVRQQYDLALIKKLGANQASPVSSGDTVTFTVSIINQGISPAYDISIIDYIPAGLTFLNGSNPGWTPGANSTATYQIPGPIAGIGGTSAVDISFVVDPTFQDSCATNTAEILFASDTPGGSLLPDADSHPNNINNDIVGANDEVNGANGDEDDHDIEKIFINRYDLALRKTTNQTTPVEVGDDVAFTITVFNQGNVPLQNIDIIDYIPQGVGLSPADTNNWITSGSDAVNTITAVVNPGDSIAIEILLRIQDRSAGGVSTNFAEIFGFEDLDMVDRTDEDVDSNGDMVQGDDVIFNDIIDNTLGDEDDHDSEFVVVEVFDLAMTKQSGSIMPMAGDTVTYTFTVYNQGIINAFDIDLIDYLPSDLIFHQALNPDWTVGAGGTVRTTIDGPILPGATATVTLDVQIQPAYHGIKLVNTAEIADATNKDGGFTKNDIDSNADVTDNDIVGGDDVINDDFGDEDDHDIDTLMVNQTFDLAAIKTANQSVVNLGDTINFFVGIINQGTLPAYDIVVVDYLPTGLNIIQNGFTTWTDVGGGQFTTVIPGPIFPNATAQAFMSVSVDPNFSNMMLRNVVEIQGASTLAEGPVTFDVDSNFDNNPTNDVEGGDNIIDNFANDEDDHDWAKIVICFDITDVTFTDPTNCGIANGSITVTTSNTSSPIEYSINNGGTWQSSNTFNGVPDGTHHILARYPDGECVADYGQITLSINDIPVIDSVDTTEPTDCGSDNGTITVNTSNPTGMNYSIDGGINWQPTNLFTNLAPGDYDVVMMNATFSCGDNYGIVTINALIPPTLTDVNSTNPSDCNALDGNIVINASGSQGVEYSIDNGLTWQASGSFINIGEGSYDVVIRNIDGTCLVNHSAPIVLEDPIQPAIEGAITNNPSDCSVDDGTITVFASPSTSSLEISIDGGATWQINNAFTGLPAGMYNVVVRNQDGTCAVNYANNPVELTTPDVVADIMMNDTTICLGDSYDILVNTVGSPTWEVVTGDATSLSCTNCLNPTVTPTVPTTYKVFVGNEGTSCYDEAIITIDTEDAILYNPIIDHEICLDKESLSLQMSVPIDTFYITGTDQVTNAVVNGDMLDFDIQIFGETAVYTVELVSIHGCAVTNTFTVDRKVLFTPEFTMPTAACEGIDVNIDYVGGAPANSFLNWDLDDGNIVFSNPGNSTDPAGSDLIVNWPTPGLKTVVLTINFNGCFVSDTMTVDIGAYQAVAAPDKMICLGASTNLSVSSGATYQWSPAGSLDDATSQNPIATPTTTTTYTVTVTDADGCSGEAQTTVTVNTINATISPDQSICLGDNIALNATGGTTYQWSPSTNLSNSNISNPVATPIATTTYTVTVTDANGCSDQLAVTVFVDPNPIVDAGADLTVCVGDNTSLNATGATSYVWSPSTNLSNANIANPIATPTATTTYYVTGTNASGCSAIDSMTVEVFDAQLVNGMEDVILCGNENMASVSISTNEVITNYTITSNTGSFLNDVANGGTLTFDATATGFPSNFFVELMASGNCIVRDTFVINKNPSLTADFEIQTPICLGENINVNYTGGAGATAFLNWNLDGAFIVNSSTATATNPVFSDMVVRWTTAGTKILTLNVEEFGCTVSETMTIVVGDVTAGVTPNTDICAGGSTQLEATGGVNYQWTPTTGLNNPNIANPIASPTTSTVYSVVVSDAQGCSDEISTVVTILFMNSSVIADQTICKGESVELFAAGGTTYQWSPAVGLDNPNSSNPVATPNVTTTYEVIVTDANNCSSTETVTVFVNPAPDAYAGLDINLCVGENVTLNGSGGVSYTWSPTASLSTPNSASTIATPIVTTTYTVTVVDAVGCTATDQVTVFVEDGFITQPIADIILCGEETTRNVTVAISDTIQSYTITGTGSYNNDITNYNFLSFDATIIDYPSNFFIEMITDGGCVVRDTFEIDANPNLTADFIVGSPVCVGENIAIKYTGGATANAVLGWTIDGGTFVSQSSGTLTAPAGADIVVNWAAGGTKEVTLTVKENGCSFTETMSIEVGDVMPVVTPNSTVCPGESIQLEASGGVTYLWTPATGLNNPNIANPIAIPTTSTFYTVLVTDAQGCSAEASTAVTLHFTNSDIIDDQTICKGESVGLFATGGDTYLWSPTTGVDNPNSATPNVTPIVTTTYSVLITDANNCPMTQEVTVFVNPAPNANAGADHNLCIGQQVTLNATGGVSYSWAPHSTLSGGNTANPIVNPTVTTTYTVTVTDNIGCTATDNITVFIHDGFLQQPIPDVTLCGDELTANVNLVISDTIQDYEITGLGAYANDVVNSNSLSFDATLVSFPSIFYVAMTTDNGCIVRDTFLMSKNEGLNAEFEIATPACINDQVSITYTGNASVNSFLSWEVDGGFFISQSPATATDPAGADIVLQWGIGGIKEVILTITENGCIVSDTMQVNIGDVNAIVGPDKAICPGDSTQLTAAGGTIYSWSPVEGLSNPNIANPMASPASSTFYTVTVSDESGCTAEATTIVTLNFTPGAVGADVEICEGESTQLTASGGLTYAWSPVEGLSNPNIANPIAEPTSSTTYTVTITGLGECVTQHDVNVTVHPALQTAIVINPPFCSGNNIEISYAGNAGAAANLDWGIAGTILNSSEATATEPAGNDIIVSYGGVSGTQIITLSVSENGCSAADTVAVFLSGGPIVEISPDATTCGGDPVQLTATGGNIYQWTPTVGLSDPTIGNPIASPTTTTTYNVVAADFNGCESTASVTITVDNNNAIAGPDKDICPGESVQLTSAGGVSYSWSPVAGLNNASIANPIASPSTTTSYMVTITNANNCISVDTVLVTVHPNTIADAGSDVAVCGNSPMQLNATGGTSYVWTPTTGLSDPNIANPIVTPTTTTTYTVTASNAGGCTSMDQIEIMVTTGFSVDVVTTPTHCCANDGAIELTPSGGTAPYTYNWNPATSVSDTGVGLDFGFYTISVTDASGCIQVVTTEVRNECDCNLLENDIVYIDSSTVFTGCLPLPFDEISNYNIWQNGVEYSNSLLACEIDTIILYSYALIDGMGNNGPYFVDSWSCASGQVFSGLVQDMSDLTDSMNVWDPTGNWQYNPSTFSIVGGDINDTYADILVRHIATNITATLQTNSTTFSSSTAITAGTPGRDHVFIIEDASTCCVDTLFVYESSPCPTLAAAASVSPANCCDENGAITIFPSGGTVPYTYNWSGNVSTTNEATNLLSGTYNITISDVNGCTTELSVALAKDCVCPDFYPNDVVEEAFDGQAVLCLPIMPADMPDYTVTLDGEVFNSFTGCNDDTLVFYTYAVINGLGNEGPYSIDSWVINDVMNTATIQDMDELVDSMNVWDPFATWMNNPATFTISTLDGTVQNYSNIQVTQVQTGLTSSMQTNSLETPFNSEMVIIGEGDHIVTISPNGDCCTDTILVTIGNCEPMFTSPYDIEVSSCDTTGVFCTGLSAIQFQGYDVLDNGSLYANSLVDCAQDSVTIYEYGNLPTNGISFYLDGWMVNGTTHNGVFNTVEDLVNLMNAFDPTGNWMYDPIEVEIIGGNSISIYGDITWTEVASNQNGIINPLAGITTSDVGLTLAVGTHILTFEEPATGCEELITVNVNCGEPSDTIIIFTTVVLDSNNLYCVSNLNLPGNTTSVVNTCSDNARNEVDFAIDTTNFCINYDGLAIGQDTACLLICNDLGDCQPVYLVTIVTNDCQDFIAQNEVAVMSTSCDVLAEICVEDFSNSLLATHQITDNNSPYSNLTGACNFETTLAYTIENFTSGSGPYQVDSWSINGVAFTGIANSLSALADSMSVWDVNSDWIVNEAEDLIYGGNINNIYTNFAVTDLALSTQLSLTLIEFDQPRGTTLFLMPGDHEIIFTNNESGCIDTVSALISCISPDIYLDTLFVAEIDTICLDTMELPGNIVSIDNYCDDGVGVNVDFTVIDNQNCVVTNGLNVGVDSACIVLCDDLGFCDTTFIYVAVEQTLIPKPALGDDMDTTTMATPVIIDVVQNDTFGLNIDSIYVSKPPVNGTVRWVGNGFEYTPNEGYCNTTGSEEFTYTLCNEGGCETAVVRVHVVCGDLIFYTGFSPNGDGVNDTFIVNGLEQYPRNRLRVFNRWGAQVFYVVGYENDWDGTWEGNDLPNGTYFYVCVSGEGQRWSGYVQINRSNR